MSRRNDRWDRTFATILDRWPTPEALAEADEMLAELT
jgi:adenine-specific DNA glycosylase